MKRCNLDCQFLSEFDLFGKEPELYFKGKPQRTSKLGKVLTYLYIIIYIAFFLYKIIRMLQKVDITFFETYAYSGIPSIKLTNDLFYGGFSLNGIIDPTIYFPVVYFYEGHRENGVMIWDEPAKILELEICQLEKFGKRYREIFKNKDLANSYCLKNVEEITLEGYSYLDSYKYLYVAFIPCVGYTPDGRQCKSIAEVSNFFIYGAKVNFNIEDVELTPHIYDNPSQPLEKDITGPAFLNLYEQIYTYLQIVILETDQDVIGFEGLSDIETQKFLKYDESWIITAPSPHQQGLQALQPIADVTIQLSAKVLTQKRKNTKLIEVLGDVGGLMEVVWSGFNILATVITDLLYDKALVNNLFSFDLDKKVIEIKNNKNKNKIQDDNIKLDDAPKLYNPKNLSNFAFSGLNNNNEYNAQLKYNINEGDLKNIVNNEIPMKVTKKKKKKIKKSVNNILPSVSRNIELTNRNLEEDNLKNQNGNNIYNISKDVNNINIVNSIASEGKILNKEKETNTENRLIIDRIKMNCCCIYFWFCFARKKKNIQNILLDEGIDIIAENLDIMNIFKKIYNINKIEQTIQVNSIFDMSDQCKIKLNDLTQSILKKT